MKTVGHSSFKAHHPDFPHLVVKSYDPKSRFRLLFISACYRETQLDEKFEIPK